MGLDRPAMHLNDRRSSARLVGSKLTAAIALASPPTAPAMSAAVLTGGRSNTTGPALAEWHKPLDTKPHGSRIAALRRSDYGSHNILSVVFHFGKHGGTMTRALRHPGRIARLAFLPLARCALALRCRVANAVGETLGREMIYKPIVLSPLAGAARRAEGRTALKSTASQDRAWRQV
jgi:hypothetical protein